MEVISPADTEHVELYEVYFRYPEGWGWSFDCDAEGNISFGGREWDRWLFNGERPYNNNPAWANLNYAIAAYCDGEVLMHLEDLSQQQKIPMRIRCTESLKIELFEFRNGIKARIPFKSYYEPCGEEIDLWGDETCPRCGQDYNAFGQRLRANYWRNPSNHDDEIGDMEGYEMEMAREEAYDY